MTSDLPSRRRNGAPRDPSRPPLPEPLPHPVVDSHCHLDIADSVTTEGSGGPEGPGGSGGTGDGWLAVGDALERASSVGVTRIVQIGCDLPGAGWAVAAAERHAAIVAGVALHPNEAPRLAADGALAAALEEIEVLAGHVDVRAVGETGLDYFRTGEDGHGTQIEAFRWHIDLANRLGKTLVVHDRDAHDDVLRVLDASGAPERLVMHCFSGGAEFARQCLDRGAFLSFSGTVTFKNAGALREALAVTPLDRVLVETDAPYLTPAPYRGRPNASYLIPVTLRSMAETRGVDLTVLCEAVSVNTDQAFGGAW